MVPNELLLRITILWLFPSIWLWLFTAPEEVLIEFLADEGLFWFLSIWYLEADGPIGDFVLIAPT